MPTTGDGFWRAVAIPRCTAALALVAHGEELDTNRTPWDEVRASEEAGPPLGRENAGPTRRAVPLQVPSAFDTTEEGTLRSANTPPDAAPDGKGPRSPLLHVAAHAQTVKEAVVSLQDVMRGEAQLGAETLVAVRLLVAAAGARQPPRGRRRAPPRVVGATPPSDTVAASVDRVVVLSAGTVAVVYADAIARARPYGSRDGGRLAVCQAVRGASSADRLSAAGYRGESEITPEA